MSKTECLHLIRCVARAAEPALGPCRLRLSVKQPRSIPFFAKKRVIADLVFPDYAWERHATGEWRNKTPCKLVRLCALRKLKATQRVEVKVCTRRGTVMNTLLDLQLGDLLRRLQSCKAPLTFDITCSSVGAEVTWPAEATYVTHMPTSTANTPAGAGVEFVAAGESSLQGEAGPRPLSLLEGVARAATCFAAHQPLLTNKSEATAPQSQDGHKQSESYRPLRFPDSGSVFVQLLKEYEAHELEAAEANTRENEKQVVEEEEDKEGRPWRPLMYLNSTVAQFLPLCFIGFFFINLHRDFIPRVYGAWAFPVRAVMWVAASVTTFLFYAISWMPAGRVTQQQAAGKQGAPGWAEHCVQCNQPRPDIARHCGICKQCVWERDHHCRYVGNCLGQDNVQAFMLMYAVMPTVSLLHCTILVGGACWRGISLTLFQCIQGVASLGLYIFFVYWINVVRNNRRRIKENHPMFFSQKQHEWFD